MAAAAARIRQEANRRDLSTASVTAAPNHHTHKANVSSSILPLGERGYVQAHRRIARTSLHSANDTLSCDKDLRRPRSLSAMSSSSAFRQQPSAADTSTGSSMEWLTPDNAASYDYDSPSPQQYSHHGVEADMHGATKGSSVSASERTPTPQHASAPRSSRPGTPISSGAGGFVSSRQSVSPPLLSHNPLLIPSANRSVETLSSTLDAASGSRHTRGPALRKTSPSISPRAPFHLRSASLGIEDDNGSLHWDPEDDRLAGPSTSPPLSPGVGQVVTSKASNLRPAHARWNAAGREKSDIAAQQDPRSGEGSSNLSTPSEGGSSSPANSASVSKTSNRRPGSVFDGMLDRFGRRRLQSRSSETRESAKRATSALSIQKDYSEGSDAVFVEDTSPQAAVDLSRPFAAGDTGLSTSQRDASASLYADNARSPLAEEPEHRNSHFGRLSGARESPPSMNRNVSSSSLGAHRSETATSAADFGHFMNYSIYDDRLAEQDGKGKIALDRVFIQVTEDNERFSVVDISGLSSSEAIKEKIMSKLHLFDDDPSCFALIRTEIGASGTSGPTLRDDEVLKMCHEVGDDRGSLKFLLQQIRLPIQPSRAAVPPPPANPTSPPFVLREVYGGSSATNPSTPTTHSRQPQSKSESLSSHSSIGELAYMENSPGISGRSLDNGSDSSANRGVSILSRSRATNRRSMAMKPIHNETEMESSEQSGTITRTEKRHEAKDSIDDGGGVSSTDDKRRGSSGYSSTDAYVTDEYRRRERHSGSGDTAVSSVRAPQSEKGRPTAHRSSSTSDASEPLLSSASISSPSSTASALPRSLLPGGGREPRFLDTADAAQMYLGSPHVEGSAYGGNYASNLQQSQGVRPAMSADDMRRRSFVHNSSAESFQSRLDSYPEQDVHYRDTSRLVSAGLAGPRPARGSDSQYPSEARDITRLSVQGPERERSASTGAGTVAQMTGRRNSRNELGAELWLDPRLASRVPQHQYAQPAYIQTLTGSVPRPRPNPSRPEPRNPAPAQLHRGTHPNAMAPPPRSVPTSSPYPQELGRAPRDSHGVYHTLPRRPDARTTYAQVHPQALQDRARFRPIPPPSHMHGQQNAPYHPYGSHTTRSASDANPYTQSHFPASSPRVVSEFQRYASMQGGLTPGKTVQEVFHQGPSHVTSAPANNFSGQQASRGATYQNAPQYPGWTQSTGYHRPASASQSQAGIAFSPERPQPPQHDLVVNPARPSNTQAARSNEVSSQLAMRSPPSDLPASIKYFYNPSTPNPVSFVHSQQQQTHSTHSSQPSTSSQSSSQSSQKGTSHRPRTGSAEVVPGPRTNPVVQGERSSGSSFASSGADSHRRVLSTEDSARRHALESDSAPTSARSTTESPKTQSSESNAVRSSIRNTGVSKEEIVNDDELVQIRLLPKVPSGPVRSDGHVTSSPAQAKPSSRGDGEDTLKAGQISQEMLSRFNLKSDEEDGGTARASSKARYSEREGNLAAETSDAGRSNAAADTNRPLESNEDEGTFANFDDEDEDDYDAQAGTWAQNLDSQPSAPAVTTTSPGRKNNEGATNASASLVPASGSGSSLASATSPRRPVLTLNIDSASRPPGLTFPHAPHQDAQKAVAQALLARSSSDAQPTSSTSGSGGITRSTSFAKRDRDWAFRPPPEQLYDNLDEYFPKHDLDKPVFDNVGNVGPNSPQSSSPRTDVQPMSARSGGSGSATSPAAPAMPSLGRSKLAPKKSIRLVAQDRKRFLEKAEAAEQRRVATGNDLARRPSTKLWGGRVVEVTPGVESSNSNAIESPVSAVSAEARPVFKWVKGDLIGKGTYGRVYLALNATTGEMIAVKQVELPTTESDREDARQKGVVSALKSEIETLKDLDHPNIVSYLGFEETTRNLSIFLEYVPGGSIGSCLRKHGKLDEATVKSFLHQILEGLSYLHGRGILHRDLKADNLLVDFNGIVKISDFGTVRRSEDIYGNVQSMSMQGSIFWMAPEVVSLSRTGYSAKVDIWSLGCVVLEMFAGRRPWSNQEAVQAMFSIGAERRAPPIPPDVRLSKAAAHFLKQCFNVNPADRPTAARLLHHVFPHAEENWQFSMSSLYHQLHR